ncbi:TetR family transcriptional regulator [Nocardiopsis exhalans]|uniref:TetR family transcriptional regulator n=1 Tax=Nocardiopsis exhalans TaxID=163604 RepID=A0ABY5D7E1_9ACTN|nr:TetR family transcriptional regulator [Nocardiopsis exhalans]USY18988.1 TetR family transcriptional regulator [Nocardiopsis exhalans]
MSSRKKVPPDEDLTARARIRDAAVECFGEKGFGVTVRVIADRASVSPGLVIHHFGSKAKLRQTCDEYVRQVIYEAKKESLSHPGADGMVRSLRAADQYSGLLAYLFRAMQEGGELSRHLYEAMVADVQSYLDVGVREGTIRPSRDPAKRARWLAANGFGSLLVLVTMQQDQENPDFGQVLHEWEQQYILPALEVYTEGLFADRTMLDAYLVYVSDPPEEER